MSTRLDEARAALAHHRTQRHATPDLFSQEAERVADNAGPVWRAQAQTPGDPKQLGAGGERSGRKGGLPPPIPAGSHSSPCE